MTDFSRTFSGTPSAVLPTANRFFRPPLPSAHVARPRLCRRLRDGLDGRLLLIAAPAGFGKSSLAIEFCESLDPRWQSLWLGLSSRESDPGRFLERLLDGLRQYHPTLGEEALGLLKMRQRHQPFAFETWLDDLLDELGPCLDPQRPLLLVLDDYHLAQGAVLDRCLQFLLNHLPEGLVLLVTSRQRPDWHLARLRLSRQLLELSEQDLRLTAEESGALMAASGLELDEDALDALLERSEGWVAGLRLWLLARGDPEEQVSPGVHGADELIRDYLLEEVIERQPPEVQAFLAQTARFERFCAELCDTVREAGDSAAILDHLQQHQVFLVPLDENGQWFRYHHLFSDLLLARPLPDFGPSAGSLHLRACGWFSRHGLLDQAVEQALRAGQPDVAASLVQNLSEEQLLAEQNIATLLRWKMDLPDSLLASTPRLILLYGWALALACQLDAAEELAGQLARFLPAPDESAQRDLLAQWQALSGVIARGRGDIDKAEAHCREALQDLAGERYGTRLQCLSTLSNLAVTRGDFWQARNYNRDALEFAQRYGNPLFEALVHYDRARVLQARGEVARADDELHRGRQEELCPRRQHPVQAGPFHQHRQHQRQRQQQRGDNPPAFAAQAALGIVLAWLPRVEQAGLVAGLFHRLQQGLAVHCAEQLEVGALAGQVDADLAYAGHLLQRPLDPADATGAGHALDGQFQAARRNLVAGLLDRRHQGRQAVRRGLYAGLLAGQVDRGGRDPGHFLQGSFDTAGAGRASHAADRQIELG